MIISCGNCSTTYTLDDALIPEAGAQVQCTRCGNVFTASRAAAAAAAQKSAPAPAPSRPKAPAAAAGSKTMIFGGDAPKLPEAPAGGGGSRTMIFGGTPPVGPPESKPAPAATNRTMIFGGDSPKPAAPAGGSKTMVFGKTPPVAGPEPKPAPAGNKTMIFGGAPGTLPSSGGPAAPPANNPGNRTMIFGGAPPSAEPREAPRAGSQTMMFGAAPVPGPEPKKPEPKAPVANNPGNRTMIFGGTAPGPEPKSGPKPGSQTMIFGGAAPGPEPKSNPKASPSAPRAGSQTMMFGAAPANEPPAGRGLTSQTLQFGPPGQAGVTDDSGQVVFGADEARDHPNKLTEGTVRIDQEELERMRQEHEAGGSTPTDGNEPVKRHEKTVLFAMNDSTQSEASASSEEPAEPKRHDRTQLFAGSRDEKPAGPVSSAEPAKHQKTQLFATNSGPGEEAQGDPPVDEDVPGFERLLMQPRAKATSATTDPELKEIEAASSVQVDSSIVDTLEPDRPPPKLARPNRSRERSVVPESQRATGPDLPSVTLPNHDVMPPVRDDAAHLDLPPEDQAPPELLAPPDPMPSSPADDAAALRASISRKNRTLALIIAGVAALLALALAWAVVGRQLYSRFTGVEIPIEALQTTETVMASLRTDNAVQREASEATVRELLVRYPKMLEAHAALVTAVALDFDEAQDRVRRLNDGLLGYQQRLKHGAASKEPAAFEREKALLEAELKKLEPQKQPLEDAAAKLNGELNRTTNALLAQLEAQPNPSKEVVQAVQRALALSWAARADARAIEAVQAWTRAGGAVEHDVWPQLAVPMFELNRSPQDTKAVREVIATLDGVANREIDLARGFILLARARLDTGDFDGADEAVEKVLALRKEHAFASELRRRIGEARLEAKLQGGTAPEAPAPTP